MSDEAVQEPVTVTSEPEQVQQTEAAPAEGPTEDEDNTDVGYYQADQRQMDPTAPLPQDRDPEAWTEPNWKDGLFPGDPNTYPDPENIPHAY